MVRNTKLCVAGGLEASGHYNTPSLLIISIVLSLCSWGIHSKELRWKSACADEILVLDCGDPNFIAIHEANFSSDVGQVENASCPLPEDEDFKLKNYTACQEDVRVAINRRCSGLGNCTFSYSDLSERKCDSVSGVVTVQYDCVTDSAVFKYCSARIRSKEGYIVSPGYPQYYPLLAECKWEIEAGNGQTVTFRLLDIHMRMPKEKNGHTHCEDAITVLEGTTRRMMVCGKETDTLQTFEADVENGLTVLFTSKDFYTGSGFLIYFKIQGCSTLPAPEDGYLVSRNGSTATYVCCQRYFFNDTQENSRSLQCIGKYRWNDTLPPCVAMNEHTLVNVSQSLDFDADENITIPEPKPNVFTASEASYMEDILVPSILMTALLLGNALIVAIILRIRRKQKSKLELEDDDISPQRSIPEATNV